MSNQIVGIAADDTGVFSPVTQGGSTLGASTLIPAAPTASSPNSTRTARPNGAKPSEELPPITSAAWLWTPTVTLRPRPLLGSAVVGGRSLKPPATTTSFCFRQAQLGRPCELAPSAALQGTGERNAADSKGGLHLSAHHGGSPHWTRCFKRRRARPFLAVAGGPRGLPSVSIPVSLDARRKSFSLEMNASLPRPPPSFFITGAPAWVSLLDRGDGTARPFGSVPASAAGNLPPPSKSPTWKVAPLNSVSP